MNEMQAILELAQSVKADTLMAIATVIKVHGSTYRRPGARMLLTDRGDTAGTISGGCLEGDVRERARKVMETGAAQIVTYDSTAPEDIVFGLGLGCNGVVHLLIEPVSAQDQDGLLTFFKSCHDRKQLGMIATAVPLDRPSTGVVSINRLLKWPDGSVTLSGPDSNLSAFLMDELECRDNGRPKTRRIDTGNTGCYELLIESVAPPTSLIIFGAGDDAIPVAHCAKCLGWHVTVIDVRPSYALPDRFPEADAVLCLHPESLFDCPLVAISPASLAMVMTHNYAQDREFLRRLLPLRLRYLGALGPRSRTRRLLDELATDGLPISPSALSCLHGPAGLDIGAETPAEIALSLLAEMQATLTRHRGGSLRDRDSGIHDVSPALED